MTRRKIVPTLAAALAVVALAACSDTTGPDLEFEYTYAEPDAGPQERWQQGQVKETRNDAKQVGEDLEGR